MASSRCIVPNLPLYLSRVIRTSFYASEGPCGAAWQCAFDGEQVKAGLSVAECTHRADSGQYSSATLLAPGGRMARRARASRGRGRYNVPLRNAKGIVR